MICRRISQRSLLNVLLVKILYGALHDFANGRGIRGRIRQAALGGRAVVIHLVPVAEAVAEATPVTGHPETL